MSSTTIENFLPPEGVPIGFIRASMASRFGAQTLDLLFSYGSVLLVILLILWSGLLSFDGIGSLALLLLFFVRVPYYIFSELVWNGRTPGKRLLRLQVISADGTRLSAHQITARNLMKELELFMPITVIFGASAGAMDTLLWFWLLGVLIVPFANRRRQRIGDILAGTIVVDKPEAVLLPDLTGQAAGLDARFHFDETQLGIYGRYELQVLEDILRKPPKRAREWARVEEVSETIRRKIGFTETVPAGRELDFLRDFYRAQRAFLEGRQLFGDSREDKFHGR